MRTLFFIFLVLLGSACANRIIERQKAMSPSKTPKVRASVHATQTKIRAIRFTIDHIPPGKSFRLKESYNLEGSQQLNYTAYYFGIPTDMNHMDSFKWSPGILGIDVFETVLSVFSGLSELKDGEPEPSPGAFIVGITKDNADSSYYTQDHKSHAWTEINTVFQKMIDDFKKNTGRPLSPDDLTQ